MDAVTPAAGRVDYDRLAAEYDRRYEFDPLQGVADALLGLTRRVPARRVLEVGCGTGRWLRELAGAVHFVCGVDVSRGMLGQAQRRLGPFALAAAGANQLPFRGQTFDLIYCVNALHHFEDRSAFLRGAFDLLQPGGALAIVATDPRRNRLYTYDYFTGSYDTELRRYASLEQIAEWAAAAGFTAVEQRRVQHVSNTRTGRDVLADPFLNKNASSHLGLLSSEAYAAGLARIEQALTAAEQRGEQLVFPYEQDLWMIAAFR